MNNYLTKAGLGIVLTSLLYAGCAGFVAQKMAYKEYDKKIEYRGEAGPIKVHLGPIVIHGSAYIPKEVKFGLKVPQSADTSLDGLVSKDELKGYLIRKLAGKPTTRSAARSYHAAVSENSTPVSESAKQAEGNVVNTYEASNPEQMDAKIMGVEKAILKYTNAERRKNGLRELSLDTGLIAVAREHSLDMANNKYFSHDNSRGENPNARALRHRYNIRKELGSGRQREGIGENIGQMATGNINGIGHVSAEADSIAKAQVEAWMNSEGHRKNILDSSYAKLGVGVAKEGIKYISTQNFF